MSRTEEVSSFILRSRPSSLVNEELDLIQDLLTLYSNPKNGYQPLNPQNLNRAFRMLVNRINLDWFKGILTPLEIVEVVEDLCHWYIDGSDMPDWERAYLYGMNAEEAEEYIGSYNQKEE